MEGNESRPSGPGRIRRWLLRPAAWLAAALALLAAGTVATAQSEWLAERGRRLLVSRLSAALGREVAVESLGVDWLPPTLEARGVAIAGRSPGEPPLATARRIVVEADLRRLLDPQPTLGRVRLEGPRLALRFAEDGTHNLPLPARRRGGEGRGVVIESLEIVDGEAALDDRRVPLELTARRVMARLAGGGPANFVGTAAAQEVEARVGDLAPYFGGVALKLRLERHVVGLLEARLSGPDLALRASGEWHWGERQGGSLDLEAEASGALFARLAWSDRIQGPFDFRGALAWAPETWSLRGRLESPALVLDGRPLEAVRAAVTAEEGALRFDPLEGTYRGGALAGAVDVELGEAPRVTVRAELAGSRLPEVLGDLGIEVQGLAGTLAGRVEYACAAAAPTAGDGRADLRLAAGSELLGPDLAVSGELPLTIRRGVVEARAARLVTQAAELEGDGAYDLGSGRGRFTFAGPVRDVGRLLAALDPARPAEPPLWRPTAGSGTVAGSLDVAPEAWRLQVEPDLTGVAAPGYTAARLTGSASLSAPAVEELFLELSRPGGTLRLVGSVPFAETEALELAIEAVAWPSSEVERWLPWPLPVAGPMSGSVALRGTLAALAGSVDVVLAPVDAAGFTADRLGARLAFGPEGTRIERLALESPAGEVAASGSLGPGEAPALDLAVASPGLDLEQEPFASLAAGPLRGRLELAAVVAGTFARPDVTATLAAHSLALGDRVLGEQGRSRLDVAWRDGTLGIEGDLLGLLDVSGGGALDADGADLLFDVVAGDLGAAAALASETPLPIVGGRLRGRLSARGPWRDGEPTVAFTGDELAFEVDGRRAALLEPARLAWTRRGLEIESLYLGEAASGSEVFLHGLVPLDGSPLDLRLQVSLASALAEPLLPGWRLGEGRLAGIGAIRGTPEQPLASGQARIDLASAFAPGWPGSIESLSGWLLFDPGRITLDGVAARFGGGNLRAAGTVVISRDGTAGYELQLSADDVAVRYPEGWWLRGGAQAVLASTPDGRRLRGSIALERAYYVEDVPIGFAQLLQGFFARRPLEVEETDEVLASTRLDLTVRGRGALRVRNNVAQLDGDVDLAVRGSIARPVVFGTVAVRPGGTLVYADNEYVVDRGELSFANPFRLEPILDLAARAELRDHDITLTLAGPLDRLDVALASEPPLADLEVLRLLAGGDAVAGQAGEGPTVEAGPGVTAAGLLYGQAAAAVGRRMRQLFGLDRFRIDPLTGSRGDLSSARITVGERISRDLYATYSYDPGSSEQQVLQLEWQVSRDLTVVATQNGDGSYALDVRVQKAF